MASFDRFVNSSKLNVFVPNVVLQFPPQDINYSTWIRKLRSDKVERKRAFFDEFLDFFLVLCLEHPDEASFDPAHPPSALLAFLAHTQVSYDASYISSASASSPSTPRQSALPRTASLKPSAETGVLHVPPSIFPPNTPHPTPMTTEQDRRYVHAEGVTLVSGMWGEESDPANARQVNDRDSFTLLWDETASVWVAIYRMCVNVAFLSFSMRDPLLCLTASITIRERPVPMTPARSVLASMLMEAGGLPESQPSATMVSFDNEIDKSYHGLDEVNLLWGLSSAPTFASAPSPLSLPSTRVGAKIRKQDFALPSDTPPMVDAPAATRPSLASGTTIRKSFRRTLSVVSGFRVRMRTVFVPYILLHPTESNSEVDHALAAGQAEYTVVLSVELEHPGEAPEAFLVEAVEVAIGVGGGANVRLLPWREKSPQEIFPLRLDMHEQCNLLFAVEIFGAPARDKEPILLTTSTTAGELQRPVTISVRGRPISDAFLNKNRSGAKDEEMDKPIFPTRAFPSRWNCVLDLTPQRSLAAGQRESEAQPEPPTPFPTTVPRLSISSVDQRSQHNPVAGFKRFVLPSSQIPRSPGQTISRSPSALRTGGSDAPNSGQLSKLAYTPPSLTAAISGALRTTYAPPHSAGIPPPALLSKMLPMGETDEAFMGNDGSTTPPPVTPAYPAYSKNSTIPATPRIQSPLSTWGVAHVPGAAVELPLRGTPSRSSPMSPSLVPFSPITPQRDCIIVSVGLQNNAGADIKGLVPYDEFALNIFIFNQSAWTRRFEVTFLERRRRRQGHTEGRGQSCNVATRGKAGGASGSGIVPLESRVRVGPLRSATCQSVRMSFLALVPGVHTIGALMLTDTETQHALTLRTSMDIVVHEVQPLS